MYETKPLPAPSSRTVLFRVSFLPRSVHRKEPRCKLASQVRCPVPPETEMTLVISELRITTLGLSWSGVGGVNVTRDSWGSPPPIRLSRRLFCMRRENSLYSSSESSCEASQLASRAGRPVRRDGNCRCARTNPQAGNWQATEVRLMSISIKARTLDGKLGSLPATSSIFEESRWLIAISARKHAYQGEFAYIFHRIRESTFD